MSKDKKKPEQAAPQEQAPQTEPAAECGEVVQPETEAQAPNPLLEELETLKQNLSEQEDKFLRLAAESDNYRKLLEFIEYAPYQIYIMGHSCGTSDRTMLNTLFEHRNCVSIKPFYYEKDDGSENYLEIVQNISRNFTNMKLMRDRVVNKQYCTSLPQIK